MTLASEMIDVSAWTGHWPFTRQRFTHMLELRTKLRSLQITQAFLAPTEAILGQDPLHANMDLLNSVPDDFFSPVPVVDLSFANWAENIDASLRDGRVKMIKLLPNYHMYDVDEKMFAPLVEMTAKHKLVISIQMRVEDVRGQHPLMKVNDVDILRVVKVLAYFPGQRFVLSNAVAGELDEVLKSLSHVWVDISSVESTDTLTMLKERYSLNHILFATHSPFYVPEGALYKLKYADVSGDDIERVAYRNAKDLLTW